MSRRSPVRRVLEILGLGVVIVLALVVILTALRTELPRSPGVMSDALGPEPGEPVAGYLARAADSLDEGAGGGRDDGSDDDSDDEAAGTAHTNTSGEARRWALVTAERALSVSEAADAVADLPRVSGLYVQTPVPGVAMPVTGTTLVEPVAGKDTREPVFARGLAQVAGALHGSPTDETTAGATPGGRVAEAEALTAVRVRAGAPAIIALVVRGATAELRDVAEVPAVRAVQALPPDAVWGRFAVRPLLPQQLEVADPLPDHAPVPVA